MKKKNIISKISSILIVSLMLTGCGKEVEIKNGSKVTVSLDKTKITATEYYNEIKEDNISKIVDMIDHNLFDKKYKTTDDEKDSIENQIKQIKSYYGNDDKTYENILKQYFGVSDEKELREKLSLEYKRKLAIKEYIKENLSDNEIKKYYNDNIFGKVSAKHILIAIDTKSDETDDEKTKKEEEAKKEAENIIKELDNGKKFEDLAKEHSQDESTKLSGGDLGYFELDEMVEEFSNAVKDLEINKYTKEPVKTEYGYHIILKTDQKAKPKLKTVKSKIKDKLTDDKLKNDNSLYYEALKEIREQNKIKWNDDKLKKAYNKYIENLIESNK